MLLIINSRCMSIAWVPGGDGAFVVAHADGNLYVYEKVSLQHEKDYIVLSSQNFLVQDVSRDLNIYSITFLFL